MAGDWIKIEHALPDKPEIDQLARLTGLDHDAVVGKLIRVWLWADKNTVNGNGVGVTFSFLDRISFHQGFAKALSTVGWITTDEDTINFVNFDRHNGQTAKDRAVTNRRVAKHRATGNASTVTDVTPAPLQKPLPEKRREDIIQEPPNPQGGMDEVDFTEIEKPTESASSILSKSISESQRIRVSAIFGRKPETTWSEKETKAFRKIRPMDEEDLAVIESYYAANRKLPVNYCRRDILTLLNNFQSEVDKSRLWQQTKHHAYQPNSPKSAANNNLNAGAVSEY